MASPQSSLRRRGRGSVSEASGHARTESDGFGSFVDASPAFPSSFDAATSGPPGTEATSSSVAFASPARTRSDSASDPSAHHAINEDTDEWADADMVTSFSPIEHHFPKHLSSATSPSSSSHPTTTRGTRPSPRRKVSGTGASSEWADWNSFLAAHTLPTQSTQPRAANAPSSTDPPSRSSNPADDAFFDAFEVATNPPRAPSPPIIDLREVEKKLDQKKLRQQQPSQPADADGADDFFSRFERAPHTALGRSSPLVLEPEQLESMHDARTSPLPRHADSYFGASAQPKPIAGAREAKREAMSGAGAASLSPASPGSWTGSLRKTWTTLRGIPSEIASHLPSASDFIVPVDEAEQGASAHAAAAESNPGGGLLFATDAPSDGAALEMGRRHSGSLRHNGGGGELPHAADYSQSTPFAPHASTSVFSSGAASPSKHGGAASLRARDLFASPSTGAMGVESHSNGARRAPIHAATAPISGAPGFDVSSERKWNTGQWTLDEKRERERRTIDVELIHRRAETEAVVEAWQAARLQALLPPRLQLGRRWSLLYSLDQHGISLQTLYHRVAAGMDPTQSARSASGVFGGDDADAEGWLRGATRETQQALGTRTRDTRAHVGGGLSSISDAGLVLAIKDGDDNVFGAFVNERLRPQQHYYGSGECFLWKTTRKPDKPHKSARVGGEGEGEVEVFRWTGKNDYMVLSESTFLSVGGGEGKFGLWIDGALDKGVSAVCPAFDNEVLCDAAPRGSGQSVGEKRFTCYGLEVWAVGID